MGGDGVGGGGVLPASFLFVIVPAVTVSPYLR